MIGAFGIMPPRLGKYGVLIGDRVWNGRGALLMSTDSVHIAALMVRVLRRAFPEATFMIGEGGSGGLPNYGTDYTGDRYNCTMSKEGSDSLRAFAEAITRKESLARKVIAALSVDDAMWARDVKRASAPTIDSKSTEGPRSPVVAA